ncbi:MAG: signal transduction histidine kinase, partial [Planctomycetota bacterium]
MSTVEEFKDSIAPSTRKEVSSAQLVVPLVLMLLFSGLALSLWVAQSIGEKLEREYLSHIEGKRDELITLVDLSMHNHLLVLRDIARLPIVVQTVMQPESNLLDVADLIESIPILGHEYRLSLVDFSGVTIYSNDSDLAADYSRSQSLSGVLSGDIEHIVEVQQVDGLYYWFIAVPVTVRGLPEGAMIAEVSFGQLLEDIFHRKEFRKNYYVEFFQEDEFVYSLGTKIIGEGVEHALGDFGITLKFYLDRDLILAEERTFIFNTALVFIVISLIALLLARSLTKRFAEGLIDERNRVAELYEQVQGANRSLESEITKHRETTRELEDAKEVSEKANRAKSEFLANMSHEIRTPMNAVLGMTDLVLDSSLTDQQDEYLQAVKASGGALLEILNDILDLSKIEAGKLELEMVEFNLRENIEGINKIFSLRAEDKGLALKCNIDSEVPDRVVGDPGRLRQIVINLVGNAIKFTESGSIEVGVECVGRGEQTVELHLWVRDEGVGIPEDKQQLIFQAFSQADNSITRQFGGTGLGLSISHLLVELMGGRIWLESTVGQGSTFHFTVHVKAGSASEIEGVEERGVGTLLEMGEGVDGPTDPAWHILLAEDNAFNQVVTTGLLKKRGHTFEVANNGQEVLELFAKGTFDVVLMDIQMPVMDGVETTLAIRTRERESGGHLP